MSLHGWIELFMRTAFSGLEGTITAVDNKQTQPILEFQWSLNRGTRIPKQVGPENLDTGGVRTGELGYRRSSDLRTQIPINFGPETQIPTELGLENSNTNGVRT